MFSYCSRNVACGFIAVAIGPGMPHSHVISKKTSLFKYQRRSKDRSELCGVSAIISSIEHVALKSLDMRNMFHP
jgi:hypothetical protein